MTDKDKTSTKPARLVVDITITDKTDLTKLERDVTRQLERIVGISVFDVHYRGR